MKNTYGVFIRIDVEAEDEQAAVAVAEQALETISKPEGYLRWEHYDVEEV